MNYQRKYKTHTGIHIHRKNPRVKQGTSKEENGLYAQIVRDFPELKVYKSDRQVLNGREIDIYIPSCHLGIEYNGNRWHSSEMDKSENYHLSKSVQAEKKGVELIHIFSDMWENRPNQVIDLIRKRLGKCQEILGNMCITVELGIKEGYDFLNTYSVNVPDPRISNYIGFMKGTKIMAVMGYSEENKEIYDFQEMFGVKVKGAIDVLFTARPEFNDYIIRCDRSLLKQDFWKTRGFVAFDCTKPRPYYTKDFKSRIRGDMLPMEESKLKESGFKVIYDCGEILMKKEKV